MTDTQWISLQQYLRTLPPLALAFSGGLDSRFLAHAAQAARCSLLLLHVQGAHVAAEESSYAVDWAHRAGLTLCIVPVDVLDLDGVRNNSERRCYYCKKHMLTSLKNIADAEGYVLCDGTNAQDALSYRPGLAALQEMGVLSPLAHCHLYKDDIRRLAAKTGLENARQKARPCLLTRLHYGMTPTATLLQNIAAAEHALAGIGLTDFRLRLCPQPVLQSVPLAALSVSLAEINDVLAEHGFTDVEIHESTNISGFFDNMIKR